VDSERQPLIQPQSSPRLGVPRPSRASDSPPRHTSGDLQSYQATASSSRSESFIRPVATSTVHHSSDEGFFFYSLIMERVKNSKVAYWADKLAVESEPNLTTAQLMLFNHDLKPVEPERRQWGAWNFVGFWVGTSRTLEPDHKCGLIMYSRLFQHQHMDDFFRKHR
jgi:NCS1 family nucleobase:cation symporter-1